MVEHTALTKYNTRNQRETTKCDECRRNYEQPFQINTHMLSLVFKQCLKMQRRPFAAIPSLLR